MLLEIMMHGKCCSSLDAAVSLVGTSLSEPSVVRATVVWTLVQKLAGDPK